MQVTADYQFENPILCCRCIEGSCNKRKGCSTIDSAENQLINRVWKTSSDPFISSIYYENRKEILNSKLSNIKLGAMNSLDIQDNFYPQTVQDREREFWYKAFGVTRRQKQQVLSTRKPKRYQRGTERQKAKQVIDDALAELGITFTI